MTTTGHVMSTRIADAINDCKQEILRDLATGDTIAAPVGSFADLHDHVDANEYGGFCDPTRRADWSMDDVRLVHDALDAWLRAGADSEPCEVCCCPIDLGDEPGQVQASGRWITVCSVTCTEIALDADATEC
jgi:hypothetical protein